MKPVAELVGASDIITYCEREKLVQCGVVVNGSWEGWQLQIPHVLTQLSDCPEPLFMGVDFSEGEAGKQWQCQLVEVDGSPSIVAVETVYFQRAKLAGGVCFVQWDVELGRNPTMRMFERVCQAMVQHAESTLLGSSASSHFKIVRVPADGFCGWHAINAAADEGYESVERNAGAYAVCKMILRDEEARAKQLHECTCEAALVSQPEHLHSRIRTVQHSSPNFLISDLHWIASTLKLKIRCTVDPKAGTSANISERANTDLYIYIVEHIIYI